MAEGLAFRGDGHKESVALLFDPNTNGPGDVGLNLVGSLAARGAILNRCQTITVGGCIHISRVGIETLTDQQTRLAVRLLARAGPVDAGGQSNISRHALADEMKRVLRAPHIFAAAADEIGF